MTPLLANPPPISVDARVVIAAVGFGLGLALARSLAGSPAGLRRSIACFAVALGLATFVLEGDIGLVSFLGGACCGGLAYVPRVRAAQRPGRRAMDGEADLRADATAPGDETPDHLSS